MYFFIIVLPRAVTFDDDAPEYLIWTCNVLIIIVVIIITTVIIIVIETVMNT